MKYDGSVENFQLATIKSTVAYCHFPRQFYKNCSYFFTVFEFPENADVITSSDALWETASRFDVRLQRALQQLVHLSVVVIVMPVKTKQKISKTQKQYSIKFMTKLSTIRFERTKCPLDN